jgi:hypothetical protein
VLKDIHGQAVSPNVQSGIRSRVVSMKAFADSEHARGQGCVIFQGQYVVRTSRESRA